VSGQLDAPATLTPGTHWLLLRAGLDDFEKRKFLPTAVRNINCIIPSPSVVIFNIKTLMLKLHFPLPHFPSTYIIHNVKSVFTKLVGKQFSCSQILHMQAKNSVLSLLKFIKMYSSPKLSVACCMILLEWNDKDEHVHTAKW
jgi:hypothetical protein